jgi:CRP-like cAMP-binding protein
LANRRGRRADPGWRRSGWRDERTCARNHRIEDDSRPRGHAHHAFSAPGFFWLGYSPIILPRRPHRVEASAKTKVWLARVSQSTIRKLLNQTPEWWQYFLQPALFYGNIALNLAADLLIRDSERRCAAVLLRLSGRRFVDPECPEPIDVSVTQDDLAGAANLSRTSVRSMLQRLTARGLIEQGYRGLIVRAPAALRAFVDRG